MLAVFKSTEICSCAFPEDEEMFACGSWFLIFNYISEKLVWYMQIFIQHLTTIE